MVSAVGAIVIGKGGVRFEDGGGAEHRLRGGRVERGAPVGPQSGPAADRQHDRNAEWSELSTQRHPHHEGEE